MPLGIEVDLELGEVNEALSNFEKLVQKSGGKVTKQLLALEKELKRTVDQSENYKKQQRDLRAALDKQLKDQTLSERKKQKIIKDFNRQNEKLYQDFYGKLNQLQDKAAKAQQKFTKGRGKQQGQGIPGGIGAGGASIAAVSQLVAQGNAIQGVAAGLASLPNPIAQASGAVVAAIGTVSNSLDVMATKQRGVSDQIAFLKTLVEDEEFGFIDALEGKAEAIAIATGTSIENILKAAGTALGSGIAQADQIGGFMGKLTRFAKSIETDADTATLAVGGMLNALGLESEKAGDIMDLLARTMDKGVFESGQALAQYVNEITSTMTLAGFKTEDLGAAMSALTVQGTKAAQAATQLNAVANELKRVEVGRELEKLGIEGFDFMNRKIVDTTKFLGTMQDAFKANENAVIDIFGSVEAKKAIAKLLLDSDKGMLEMREQFTDVSGAADRMWGLISNTDQREIEKRTQRWEAMQRKVGSQFNEVQKAVNSFISSLFQTSDDRAQEAFANMEQLSQQAKTIGSILEEGLSIETDFDPTQAESFFKSIESNIDEISNISPIAAANIQRIIDASEGATPTALEQINKELEIMKTRIGGEEAKAAVDAISESFDNSIIDISSRLGEFTNITDDFEGSVVAAFANLQDSASGLAQSGVIEEIAQQTTGTFDLFTKGLEGIADETNEKLGQVLALGIDNFEQAGEEILSLQDKILEARFDEDLDEITFQGMTLSLQEAEKIFLTLNSSISQAGELIESQAQNITRAAEATENLGKNEEFYIQELLTAGTINENIADQIRKRLAPAIEEREQAEFRATVEQNINDTLDKRDEGISELQTLNDLYDKQTVELVKIAEQIQDAVDNNEDYSQLIEDENELFETQSIIQDKINEADKERIDNEKSINDVLTANNLSMDDLLKAQDGNILKEKAILVAKKNTLLAIKAELINRLQALKQVQTEAEALQIVQQSQLAVNKLIEDGNKLMEARQTETFGVTTTVGITQVDTANVADEIKSVELQITNVDNIFNEVNKSVDEMDKGLGNVNKSAKQVVLSLDDIRKETQKIVSERADLEFEASIVDLEGAERDLAVLDRNFKDMIANLPPELADNQRHMEQLWGLHQQKVSAINRTAAQERAEDEKKAAEDAAKVREDKAKEAAKQQEDMAKKAADRQKKLQEEAIKAIEERRKREQQFNDFLIGLNAERLGAVSGLEQRATLVEQFRSQREQILKDFGKDNEKGKLLLSRLQQDTRQQLIDFSTNVFKSSEELFDLQRDRALQAFNNTLSILGGVSGAFDSLMLKTTDGLTGVPWDVFIDNFEKLIAIEDISIDRLNKGLVTLRRNAADEGRSLQEVAAINDLIVQFELKKVDIAQDRDSLLLRELSIMKGIGDHESELSELQLKTNRQRIEALELTKDTEISRLRIVELEEENLDILTQLIQPYKDANQSALDFLDQRNEGLEGEKTALDGITDSYNEQTELLNGQIDKLEKIVDAEKVRSAELLDQIASIDAQKVEQQALLDEVLDELEPYKEKHSIIMDTNDAIQDQIDLQNESVGILDDAIEKEQEIRDRLEENVKVIQSGVDARKSRIDELDAFIEKAQTEGRPANILIGNKESLKILQEQEEIRLRRAESQLEEFNQGTKLNELLEEKKDIQLDIAEKQAEINKNSEELGPDQERVRLLQDQVTAYEDQLDILDEKIDITQKSIDLDGQDLVLTEKERKELEKSKKLHEQILALQAQETRELVNRNLETARKTVSEIGMTQFQKDKQSVQDRIDDEIEVQEAVFEAKMENVGVGSAEAERLAIELEENVQKVRKKGQQELLVLQAAKAQEVISAIGGLVGLIDDVINIIEGTGDLFNVESIEDILVANQKILVSSANVMNQFGPIGETIGGAFSVTGEIIGAIATAIENEISQSQMLAITIGKQTAELNIQKGVIEELIKMGNRSLDTASEQLRAYERISDEAERILKLNSGIAGDAKNQEDLLARITELKELNVFQEARIVTHKIKGRASDEDAVIKLQANIDHNQTIIDQLQDQLDVLAIINDLRKKESRELLDQIDFMDQTGLSDEIALQTKKQIIDQMLTQKGINGALLFSEQERNDLLLEQQGILEQIEEIQLSIEQSILRQKGFTEDSIIFLMSQLSGLQSDALKIQEDAFEAIQNIGIADMDLPELSKLLDKVKSQTIGGAVSVNQIVLDQIEDLLAKSGLTLDALGGIDQLIGEVNKAILFDEQAFNQLLEDEDDLTKGIIDKYFEVQQSRLEHRLALGEITQEEFDQQNADLVATWAKVYEDARTLLETSVLDPTTFDQVMADINEQFGDIAAQMGVDLADLDIGDLIISEQDLFDIQEKGIQAGKKFVNGLADGLSEFQRIQFQLDKLKHAFDMGEITAEEFSDQRVILLNQQLDILLGQKDALDDGLGLTKEKWDLDKDIWKLQEEISGLMEDQTAEMLKQAGLGDKELERLSKKRQLFIESARAAGTFTSPEVQNQLAQIEADIVARMRELGVDDATIFNAIQAMQEQRSFEEGGEIPSTGPIFGHKKEEIIPALPAQSIREQSPGFFESLRAAQTPSGVQRVMQESVIRQMDTDAAIRQQTFNNITNIQNSGGNSLDFNISGVNPDLMAKKIIDLVELKLPAMLVRANQKAGIAATR